MPASDVPGEAASPSQPFPTKPKPFAKQGFASNDIVDFTPEIRARALDAIKDYRVGPLFTPPSLDGTIVMPGAIGGAGWGGGAFDPHDGHDLHQGDEPAGAVSRSSSRTRSDSLNADYTADSRRRRRCASSMPPRDTRSVPPSLPINKPPYGTLVAIDLNTGDHKWNVTLGDTPAIRNHPLLKI